MFHRGKPDNKASLNFQAESEKALKAVEAEIHYLSNKETNRDAEFSAQKQTIRELSDKLETQEKVIRQISGQSVKLGKAEMKVVTDEVMNRLHKELHLERQRRGLM